MAIQAFPDLDTRYVAPYSQDGLDGYLVRVPTYPEGARKSKRWHTKLFAFKKYATLREAILAALAYRDSWFKSHAEESRLRPAGAKFTIKLPSNNTSGIVGVNRTERLSVGGSSEIQWQTTFSAPTGQNVNRKFSAKRFGEVGALRRAVEARRDGMLEFLTTVNEMDLDVNLEVVSFYDDVLANLKDYADDEASTPILEIVRAPDIPATTKLEQLFIRIGQQRFRREVLANFKNRCAVTGSTVLIRASHIKPWRICSDEDRLNPHNGLALSPVYDAAFDLGLLTFSADGRVVLSPKFADDAIRLGISGNEQLSLLLEGHHQFMAWHRTRVYVGGDA